MSSLETNDIEDKYVHAVYKQIANHFDETRVAHWDEVKKYINSLPTNCLVGDLGCGNGKNMLIRQDLRYKGSDMCDQFVQICLNKKLDCRLGNLKNLPFNNNEFDHSICIAVIHHLATEDNRIRAIQELVRVTRNQGTIMIQVWANLGKNQKNEQDRLTDWKLTKKHNQLNPEQTATYSRYYHYFNENELENICQKAGNVIIIRSFLTCGNYGVILKVNKSENTPVLDSVRLM